MVNKAYYYASRGGFASHCKDLLVEVKKLKNIEKIVANRILFFLFKPPLAPFLFLESNIIFFV